MSERTPENIDIVKRVLAAFKRGDTQTFLSLLSDDVDFRHPMSTDIWPWAGKRRGRAEVGESWARLAEVSEFEEFEPGEIIAQGDKVVVLVFERIRIRATGRAIDNEYVHVFTVREGQVVQFCVYEDTAPIIAAIRNQDRI